MFCIQELALLDIHHYQFFLKTFSPLLVCVLNILSILKKKKVCTQNLSLNFGPLNNIFRHYKTIIQQFQNKKFIEGNCKILYICMYNLSFLMTILKIIPGVAIKHRHRSSFYNLKTFSLLL